MSAHLHLTNVRINHCADVLRAEGVDFKTRNRNRNELGMHLRHREDARQKKGLKFESVSAPMFFEDRAPRPAANAIAQMPTPFNLENQQWSIYWFSRKKKKHVRKRFYEDFGSALKFFTEHQHFPNITLHVDNHPYAPPTRITEHEREKIEVVTRKGKRYKRRTTEVVNLMEEYNRKGIWWCGYCIKLRRFKEAQTAYGVELFCPVCTASHRVNRRFNPLTTTVEYHKPTRRTSGRASRRRKRRGD